MQTLCPDTALNAALSDPAGGEEGVLTRVEALIEAYPEDARLYFLRGSLLAGLRRYPAGAAAMAEALRIAPDYEIARFQLGFLHFTSGDATEASQVWAPLTASAQDAPLRLFVEGLQRLAADDWDGAAERLERGIALNTVNAPLNTDMRRLLSEIAARRGTAEEDPMSDTQRLLQRYDAPSSRH